ncbi:MAG: magnesium/cobalt transporter CorA [Bacteroidales bacterium]|nr:magnesium/cobalt transporter CorA [Bacteroidales bacterium]
MARFLKTRQKSHGEAPGSLIFIGKQKMENSQIRAIEFNKESIIEKELQGIDHFKEHLSKKHTTWLNIDGLHEANLMEQLRDMFSIPALIMEDILNTDQRPKIWIEEDKIIIILKAMYYDQKERLMHNEQISFIIGDNHLITLQERIGDFFEPVRDRLRKGLPIREKGPDYLCYALMDTLVDLYISNIETLGSLVEDLETMILNQTGRDIVNEIYRHKTEISYMRKSIRPLKEVMVYLLKPDITCIKEPTQIYLKDLDDLLTQATEAIEIYYNMLTDHLTIYHTNLSNKVNEVMKVLTIFASIFIPLTFIAGVYGTNFDNLPELHFRYGYFYMWGVMILMAGGMLLYFKRKKWL